MRIFIAINLSDNIKRELLDHKEKWQELPARWTTPENLHLTLLFLGNTSEAELQEVMKISERVGESNSPFELAVTRIAYGPLRLRSGQAPKMIWAMLAPSEELRHLHRDLERKLAAAELYTPEKRGFTAHFALARLKMFELQRMELEELPQVDEEISLSFLVESFAIMQSQLKRSGAEYSVLQSFMLQK